MNRRDAAGRKENFTLLYFVWALQTKLYFLVYILLDCLLYNDLSLNKQYITNIHISQLL